MLSTSGVDSLTKVGGDLTIRSNPRLETLMGLHRIAFVGGQLSIEHQPQLDSLDALYGVRRVGGNLELKNNRLLDGHDTKHCATPSVRVLSVATSTQRSKTRSLHLPT